MKILLVLFMAVSCSKVKYQEIPKAPEKNRVLVSVEADFSSYSPNIDVMVAFLWPEKIKVQDRPRVTRIIEISRDLKTRNKDFQLISVKLRGEYAAANCSCALNGECDGSEGELNEILCYEIEDATYANDRKLVEIYGLVEEIKTNILSINGEWLQTHMDFREIPTSKIDFNKMSFSFSALGAYLVDGVSYPIAYKTEANPIIQELSFQRLEFTLARVLIENNQEIPFGEWTIDVGINRSEISVLFQGELHWNYLGQARKGIIFWENPASF
jgi:hypothetical protein